jgi:predicted phosphate transport protein (TIGR00153 family)
VDTSFYDLFTSSAQQLVVGAELLAEMLADGADSKDVSKRMRTAESESDEITHEIVRKVNATFVTPFDREDIYALGNALDDVMDFMEQAVDQIRVYEVKKLPAELSDQVTVLQRCAEVTAEAMPRLQALSDLDEYWIEVGRLEKQGDKNHRRILAKLFSGEFKAMEVLKLKDIVESLESAVNAFEDVANIVEQIAVKES